MRDEPIVFDDPDVMFDDLTVTFDGLLMSLFSKPPDPPGRRIARVYRPRVSRVPERELGRA